MIFDVFEKSLFDLLKITLKFNINDKYSFSKHSL